jgi:mRNA interferase MazF
VARAYVPERGDIIWLEFNPQAGHEQAGYRPAFVVSPRAYHRKAGLALVCPVTSRIKGYPFEVPLPAGGKTRGVILSDQVKSLDWRARKAAFVERVVDEVVAEVTARIVALVGQE